MFPSNVAKNNWNLRILSGPSDIWHLKITIFLETCNLIPWVTRISAIWQVHLSLTVSAVTGRSVKTNRILRRLPRRMSIWPVKPNTCHLFLGDSGHLLIQNCWSSAGGKKIILPFPLSLPLLQFVWGICSKIPSSSVFARDPDPRVKGVCGGDYP